MANLTANLMLNTSGFTQGMQKARDSAQAYQKEMARAASAIKGLEDGNAVLRLLASGHKEAAAELQKSNDIQRQAEKLAKSGLITQERAVSLLRHRSKLEQLVARDTKATAEAVARASAAEKNVGKTVAPNLYRPAVSSAEAKRKEPVASSGSVKATNDIATIKGNIAAIQLEADGFKSLADSRRKNIELENQARKLAQSGNVTYEQALKLLQQQALLESNLAIAKKNTADAAIQSGRATAQAAAESSRVIAEAAAEAGRRAKAIANPMKTGLPQLGGRNDAVRVEDQIQGKSITTVMQVMGIADIKEAKDLMDSLHDRSVETVMKVMGIKDVSEAKKLLASVEGKSITEVIHVIGEEEVEKAKLLLASIQDKSVEAVMKVIGGADVEKAKQLLWSIEGSSVQAVMRVTGVKEVEKAKLLIASIEGKSVEAVMQITGEKDVEKAKLLLSSIEDRSVEGVMHITGEKDVEKAKLLLESIKGKSVEAVVQVIGGADVEKAKLMLASIQGKSVEAVMRIIGGTDVEQAKLLLESIQDKSVEAVMRFTGINDAKEAKLLLASIDGKSVETVMQVMGMESLQKAKQLLDSIKNKRVEVIMQTKGDSATPPLTEKSLQHMERTKALNEETARSFDKLRRSLGSNSMGFLAFSQAVEDAQYGIKGVLNNIPQMVMGFGGGMGLAGAISLAAVAAAVLYPALKRLYGSLDNERIKLAAAEWGKVFNEGVKAADATYKNTIHAAELENLIEAAVIKYKQMYDLGLDLGRVHEESLERLKQERSLQNEILDARDKISILMGKDEGEVKNDRKKKELSQIEQDLAIMDEREKALNSRATDNNSVNDSLRQQKDESVKTDAAELKEVERNLAGADANIAESQKSLDSLEKNKPGVADYLFGDSLIPSRSAPFKSHKSDVETEKGNIANSTKAKNKIEEELQAVKDRQKAEQEGLAASLAASDEERKAMMERIQRANDEKKALIAKRDTMLEVMGITQEQYALEKKNKIKATDESYKDEMDALKAKAAQDDAGLQKLLREKEIRKEIADLIKGGYDEPTATIKANDLVNARDNAASSDARSAYKDEMDMLKMQAAGDEEGIESLKKQREIQKEIAALIKANVPEDEAKAMATALVEARQAKPAGESQSGGSQSGATQLGAMAQTTNIMMGRVANDGILQENRRQTSILQEIKKNTATRETKQPPSQSVFS